MRPVPTSAGRPPLPAALARCRPLPLILCSYHSFVSTRIIHPIASVLFTFHNSVIRPSTSMLFVYPISFYLYHSPICPYYSPIHIHVTRLSVSMLLLIRSPICIHITSFLYPHYLPTVSMSFVLSIHFIHPSAPTRFDIYS